MVNHPFSPLEIINRFRHCKGIKCVLLVAGEPLLAGSDALVQPVLLLQRPVDETQVSQLLAAHLEVLEVSGNQRHSSGTSFFGRRNCTPCLKNCVTVHHQSRSVVPQPQRGKKLVATTTCCIKLAGGLLEQWVHVKLQLHLTDVDVLQVLLNGGALLDPLPLLHPLLVVQALLTLSCSPLIPFHVASIQTFVRLLFA